MNPTLRPGTDAPSPRQYVAGPAGVPAEPRALGGFGLPHERHMRIAAQRSFQDLRQAFERALALLDGPRAEWLNHQVAHAQEPVDLWLLRGMVFDTIEQVLGLAGLRVRQELQRAIDIVFPQTADEVLGLARPLLR